MKVRIWTLTVDDDGDKVNGPIRTHVFGTEDECWASLRNNYDADGEVPAGDNDALMKHVMTQGVAFYIDAAEVDAEVTIEIMHSRDPDSECDLDVLANGERVDFSSEDIDPGRGHMLSDWNEHTEWVLTQSGYSPNFIAKVASARDEARENRYIEDDTPPPTTNPVNGRNVEFPEVYPGIEFVVLDGEAGIYRINDGTDRPLQINHDATKWHYLDEE